MTLTLTAVDEPDAAAQPRMKLTASSTLNLNSTLVLTRIHADASEHRVIVPRGARLSTGDWVGFDYHAPFDQFVSYRMAAGVETSVATVPRRLESEHPWLIHATNPALSVRAEWVDILGDPSFGDSDGIFDIIGSTEPISVSDGTMRETSSVTLSFTPGAQLVKLLKLIRAGGPLLLNIPTAEGWDVDWRWIKPTGRTIKNTGATAKGGHSGWPVRQVDIPYVAIAQPEMDLSPLWRVIDVRTVWPTVASVTANYATVADLRSDTRIP